LAEKLKILFLITDLGKGGAERYLIDLCNELKRYPFISFKIGILYNYNLFEKETSDFDIIPLNFETFSFGKKNKNDAYLKLLQDFKPNVIHSHRFLGEFLSSYYIDKNIKYICHGHDNMIQFENFGIKTLTSKQLFIQYLEKLVLILHKYRKVKTTFIANSKHTFQYFNNTLKSIPNTQVIALPYGLNLKPFRHELQTKKNEKIKILNVGSFQAKKNQQFMIEIAMVLKSRNIDFEMNLLGSGDLFEKVKQKIFVYGLENEVKLRGIIHNVSEWYKEADIYVHSAYYEPFGLIFIEAMAAQLPIVALDGKGNRDLIENGKTGFIIEEQNPEIFANKILEVIEDEKLRRMLIENGIEKSKEFDIEVVARKMIELYSDNKLSANNL
jgi:glycosyltransferase involved in cell wall biosynthesis